MTGRREKPDIIFIFSDQQRWDTLGCYGHAIFPGLTPNLDQMAREGVRFEYAFSPQPVCGPARACVQTGKWATETGCFRNGIALPTEEKTIAHHFSSAGYQVGYVGKWHLASTPGQGIDHMTKPVPVDRRGGYGDFWLASDVLEFTSHAYDGHLFDKDNNRVEFPAGRYRVDCITDFAIDIMRQRDERPLFLFVSYIEPHQQNDHGHFEGPIGSKEQFKNYAVPGDLEKLGGDWALEMPDYLGQVNSLDRNVGRIREAARESGTDDSTLFVYTSDHGCHFRTRNSEYKRSCHDSSIRVPMVLCGPGFTGGNVSRELVSLIDLPPTLLTVAGLKPPTYMKGRSLLPLLEGKVKKLRDEVFVQISEDHVGRAIRTKRWKYSVRAQDADGGRDPASPAYVEECLYDLRSDPHELHNLVTVRRYAKVRRDLARRLVRRISESEKDRPEIYPATQAI